MANDYRWEWDARSLKVLAELNKDLMLILQDARRFSDIEFQLVDGARTIAEQQALFDAKKTKINPAAYVGNLAGLYAAGRHIVGPGKQFSDAVDVIVSVRGKEYDTAQLAHLAGVLQTIGNIRGSLIRWGGNWDGDQEVITDQEFDDLVHFELKA
jgi:hypothetical protein